MNDCQRYEELIERYLDGTITDSHLAELEAHTQECESCRLEFERCVLLGETIRESFAPGLAAERAGASVLAKLAAQPQQRRGGPWLLWGRVAAAACVLLAVGSLAGFVLGRAGAAKEPQRPPLTQVPVQVAELHGTVLVRHRDYDVWHVLEAGSDICLGDTFHSTANSGFVLQLAEDSTIEVDQNSMLALTSYNGQTQFFLEHGECTANLESPHGPFFISTPHGRVEALGTEFTVTVE
ncbi:MAG: FecR domain-containing protein [Sedimentisphaerales bacterium]|nr:FecR domain-containing protein [Sedimentisphaerales bacterium]